MLAVELYLQAFDPWGMVYVDDTRILLVGKTAGTRDAPLFAPGFYDLDVYDATVLPDHTRLVPDTQRGQPCQIVALGDSQTFGMGVNDHETWVNQLARRFPDVTFVNGGVPGYDLANGIIHMDRFPEAAAFIYLTIENDTYQHGAVRFRDSGGGMIGRYINYVVYTRAIRTINYDLEAFNQAVETLQQYDNLILVAAAPFTHIHPAIEVLNVPEQTVSLIDRHGNAQWHMDMAAALHPYAARLIEDFC